MKENLHPNSSDNNLLIRIHPEGITYAITDENEQVILQQMINMPPGKLKDARFLEHFLEQPELRVLSENVSVVFENSNYQLIPNELFKEDDVSQLFELEFEKNDNVRLIYNLLPRWGAHLIHSVESSVMDLFEKKYPDAEIEHHVSKLLKRKIDRNTDTIYANVRKETVDLFVVKENRLLLTNSFQTNTNEDICYFVLNAYEQLELDTKTIPLKLFSEDAVDKSLVELLEQYITDIAGVIKNKVNANY